MVLSFTPSFFYFLVILLLINRFDCYVREIKIFDSILSQNFLLPFEVKRYRQWGLKTIVYPFYVNPLNSYDQNWVQFFLLNWIVLNSVHNLYMTRKLLPFCGQFWLKIVTNSETTLLFISLSMICVVTALQLSPRQISQPMAISYQKKAINIMVCLMYVMSKIQLKYVFLSFDFY